MKSSDYRKDARIKLTGKWGKVAIITLIYVLVYFVFGLIEGFLGENSPAIPILQLIQAIIQVPLSFGFIIALFKVFHGEESAPFDFISLGFENFKRAWGVAWHVFLKLIVPIIIILIIIIVSTSAIVMKKAYYLDSEARASSQEFSSISSSLLSDLPSSGYSTSEIDTVYSMFFSSGIVFVCAVAILIVSIWLTCKSYYYSLSYIIATDEPELTTKEAVEKSKELMTGKRGKLFILQLSFIGWFFLLGLVAGVFGLLEKTILPLIIETVGCIFLVPYIQFANFSFYENLKTAKSIDGEVLEPQSDDPIKEN